MPKFRPLSKRDDESYDALHEGVPPWLSSTLIEFVTRTMTALSVMGVRAADRSRLQKVEREVRMPLQWGMGGENGALNDLYSRVTADADLLLDIVDWCLKEIDQGEEDRGARLMVQLEEGGSAWSVGVISGDFRLIRRVDETVAAAAREVISASGRAGQHLSRAWGQAYGRHPDPSSAYREAVRAVEAVGEPVISPTNDKATLGTMIADIQQKPSKWEVVLKPTSGDPVLMLLETMRLLWTAELDRHGTADESVPLHVSPEEAQAAVHLASTLVHWFQSGAIKTKR